MRPRVMLLAVAVLASAVPSPRSWQFGATQTATIGGRIVDGATGKPVRGALVSAFNMGRRIGAVTGPDGHFLITGLLGGVFRLTATKSGYFEGAFGRRRPGTEDEPVQVNDGANAGGIELLLWAEAMISGTVTDEAGEAVSGVRVIAMPRDGQWDIGAQPFAVTDATGRYTIAKLKPGGYIVGTTLDHTFDPEVALPGLAGQGHVTVSGALVPPFVMAEGTRRIYTGTLYPDAESVASAAVMTVSSGEERSGVDLSLPLRPTVRVSGQVLGPAPLAGPVLAVLSNDAVRFVSYATADGAFSFAAVAAGRYQLEVLSGSSSARATDLVTVGDQEVSGIVVTSRRKATVSGLVEAADRLPSVLSIQLAQPSGTKTAVTDAIAGRFAFADVEPGAYLLRVWPGPGWRTESVDLAGRDITDVPFDVDDDVEGLVIHATDQPAELSGKVRQSDGAVAHNAAVVVFPSNPGQWNAVTPSKAIHFQRVRPKNGDYAITDLPAGDYLIAAVDDVLLDDWPRKALLSTLSSTATRLRLARGDKLVRDLVMRDR